MSRRAHRLVGSERVWERVVSNLAFQEAERFRLRLYIDIEQPGRTFESDPFEMLEYLMNRSGVPTQWPDDGSATVKNAIDATSENFLYLRIEVDHPLSRQETVAASM